MKEGQLMLSGRAGVTGAFAPALLAGFAASLGMVLAFAIAFASAVILGHLPVPLLAHWFRGLTSNPLVDTAGPNLYAATAIFFVGGVFWALVYGLDFAQRLHGSAWQRGALFALIPWLFSLVIFLPLVGVGVLGIGLGAGPLPTLGNLILHTVYGVILGVVYGAAEPSDSVDLQAGRISERGAARGLIAGLTVGVLVGIVAAALIPQITTAQTPASNPLATVLAGGLTGAAFGSFVGSLLAT